MRRYGIAPTRFTDVGMIEQPNDALYRNQIDYARALYDAQTDPYYNAVNYAGLGLSMLGNSITSVGQKKLQNSSKVILADRPIDYLSDYVETPEFKNQGYTFIRPEQYQMYNPLAQYTMQPLQFAYGGEVPNVPVEVEGDEYIQPPMDEGFMIQGPSHEQGGIPINLPQGTQVFSDRIKRDGFSMAQRKAIRDKNLKRLEKKHQNNPYDKLSKDTYQKYKAVAEFLDQDDMNYQRQFSNPDGVYWGGGNSNASFTDRYYYR